MFWMLGAAVAWTVFVAAYMRRATSGPVDPDKAREAREQYFKSMKRFPW